MKRITNKHLIEKIDIIEKKLPDSISIDKIKNNVSEIKEKLSSIKI